MDRQAPASGCDVPFTRCTTAEALFSLTTPLELRSHEWWTSVVAIGLTASFRGSVSHSDQLSGFVSVLNQLDKIGLLGIDQR